MLLGQDMADSSGGARRGGREVGRGERGGGRERERNLFTTLLCSTKNVGCLCEKKQEKEGFSRCT
jgi:hypothetical protein